MEINKITIWMDIQKAILDLLVEKGVITRDEIRKKVIEANSLTDEKLDEILKSSD